GWSLGLNHCNWFARVHIELCARHECGDAPMWADDVILVATRHEAARTSVLRINDAPGNDAPLAPAPLSGNLLAPRVSAASLDVASDNLGCLFGRSDGAGEMCG